MRREASFKINRGMRSFFRFEEIIDRELPFTKGRPIYEIERRKVDGDYDHYRVIYD